MENKHLSEMLVKWKYEVVYIRRGKLAVKVFNYCIDFPKDLCSLDLPEDVAEFTSSLSRRKIGWYAYLFKNPSGNYCSHAKVN